MDVMEKLSSEKRLIDANKLIDFIDVGHLRHPGELCWSELDVANLLLHAPTVDAVLVVRCKDCKHHHDCEIHFCDALGMDCPDDSEFFCFYGERKEGADNG